MIAFACHCGKKLQIIDDHAGKKIKCPRCGTISLAPQLSPPTVSLPGIYSTPSNEDDTLGSRKDVVLEDDPESALPSFLRPPQAAEELKTSVDSERARTG